MMHSSMGRQSIADYISSLAVHDILPSPAQNNRHTPTSTSVQLLSEIQSLNIDLKVFHVYDIIDAIITYYDENSIATHGEDELITNRFNDAVDIVSSGLVLSNDEKVIIFRDKILNSSKNSSATLLQCCRDIRTLALEILAEKHFLNFIKSKFYGTWRKKESRHALAFTITDAKAIVSQKSSRKNTFRKSSVRSIGSAGREDSYLLGMSQKPNHDIMRLGSTEPTTSGDPVATNSTMQSPVGTLHHQGSLLKQPSFTRTASQGKMMERQNSDVKSRRKSNLSVRAFSDLDDRHLKNVLTGENWMAVLFAAAEGLPIAFAASAPKGTSGGFPVITVNKKFETMTGYSRSELIGKSLKILQTSDNKIENAAMVKQFSRDLCERRPGTYTLINTTKQGKKFKNLVSMKPIVNDRDEYCYVLAICLDVTAKNSAEIEESNEMMESLIQKLPYFVLHEMVEQ